MHTTWEDFEGVMFGMKKKKIQCKAMWIPLILCRWVVKLQISCINVLFLNEKKVRKNRKKLLKSKKRWSEFLDFLPTIPPSIILTLPTELYFSFFKLKTIKYLNYQFMFFIHLFLKFIFFFSSFFINKKFGKGSILKPDSPPWLNFY